MVIASLGDKMGIVNYYATLLCKTSQAECQDLIKHVPPKKSITTTEKAETPSGYIEEGYKDTLSRNFCQMHHKLCLA